MLESRKSGCLPVDVRGYLADLLYVVKLEIGLGRGLHQRGTSAGCKVAETLLAPVFLAIVEHFSVLRRSDFRCVSVASLCMAPVLPISVFPKCALCVLDAPWLFL